MFRWLKNLKVGAKIRLGFAAIGLIFLANVALIISVFNQINVLNDRVSELRAPTAEYSQRMLNGLNHSLGALRGWLLIGEEHFKEERQEAWNREIEVPLSTLEILSENWTNPDNKVRFQSIKENLKDFRAYQNEIESLSRTSGWARANQILSEKAAPTAKALAILIREMAENQKILLAIDLNESRNILNRGERLLWAAFFLSVSFGFVVAIPITLSITRPLERITDFSNKIAAGDLKQEMIKRDSKDEIGILTYNLNQMVFGLLGTLKEKESRNFAILYNIEDPLIEVNEQGIIGTFNPASVKTFGYPASEMMGKNVNILIPNADPGKYGNYFENHRKTKQVKTGTKSQELVGRRKDGSLFPMDLSVNEFKVKNKKRFVGICRDITERKQVQDRIEKANRDLEKQNWMITHLGEISDRMRGDQDSTELAQNIINCLSENLRAQRGVIYLVEGDVLKIAAGYGFSKEEELGSDFMIGEGLVGKVVLEKQKIVINNVAKDHIGLASGLGDSQPANIMIVPLMHEGIVMGVVELGFSAPVNDHQEDFIKQAEDGMAIALNSALARVQMKQLLAETQAQAEELTAQKEELEQIQEELQQSNLSLEKQAQNLSKQKNEIEEKNELVKLKIKELETAGRYKSEFLANMSHELRTPLNSLLILSQLLAENKGKNLTDKQVEFAKTIHSSGSDLLDLISDILDLSKVEAGKMEINLEDVSLISLSDSLKRTFSPIAEQKKLELKIELDDGIPDFIWTDVQRVEQIVKNFLSNAFKFTETGGITLRFHTVEPGIQFSREMLNDTNTVGISVTDTGKGIPQDKQDYIFEAFQQEDGTTSRKFGGTGLGLSISKELSKLLAGEIHIKSKEGEGSTFTVYLPETHPSSKEEKGQVGTQKTEPKSQISTSEAPKSKLILIIEDDPHFSKIISATAKENDFDSIVAGDGNLGLELAKKIPAAIILDVTLPGMDGLEVIQKLQSDTVTQNIPVYIISAHHDKAREALEMGAVDFTEKPVSLERLKGIFEKIISSSGRLENQILIVEDDEDVRESMIGLFSGQDVNILTAETVDEATDLLRKHTVKCMTVDLGLNGKSGFDLLHEIKNDKTLPKVPVIIYTGESLSVSQEEELAYFSKAVIIKGKKSPERLLEEINIFLNNLDQPPGRELPLEELNNPGKDISFAEPEKVVEPEENSSGEMDLIFKSKKILLADDDMRNVFALTHLLEERDVNVIVARNGREAVDTLKLNPDTDLVLMDIMMPEMDGYAAMQEIRSDDSFSGTPIIALTAKAMKNDKEKCLDAGASDYLVKPIDQNKLFTQMSAWLQEKDLGNG